MPSTTSKNLGQVAAFVAGPTPPTNINLIWLDTSGIKSIKKIWDPSTNTWINFTDAGQVTGDNWGTQVVVHDDTLAGDGITGDVLKIAQQGATTGQVLKWDGNTWLPANDETGNGLTTVSHSQELAGDGTVGQPLLFAQQNATVGQVLKWNGSSWVPGNDEIGVQFTPGMIMLWCGTIGTIPGGWVLCNGQGNLSNGQPVPNLSGMFVVGYNASDADYNQIGKSAGLKTVSLSANQNGAHTHGVNDPSHSHNITGSNIGNNSGGGSIAGAGYTGFESAGSTEGAATGIQILASGNGEPHENRPPYYTLAYIVKL